MTSTSRDTGIKAAMSKTFPFGNLYLGTTIHGRIILTAKLTNSVVVMQQLDNGNTYLDFNGDMRSLGWKGSSSLVALMLDTNDNIIMQYSLSAVSCDCGDNNVTKFSQTPIDTNYYDVTTNIILHSDPNQTWTLCPHSPEDKVRDSVK